MPDFIKSFFYWLDLLVGFGCPLLLFTIRRRDKIGARDRRLFGLGALIGLAWEIPIFTLSRHSALPLIVWIRELPLPYGIFMIAHTLWDGVIFLVGVRLVDFLCRPPVFKKFRFTEIFVLLAWGQISALLVELSSVVNKGWVYVEGYPWNPTLFTIDGYPITILQQVIWLPAPVIFYFAALRLTAANRP